MPKLRAPRRHAIWRDASYLTDETRDAPAPFNLAQSRREREPYTPCVYFIRCGDYVKIGTTTRGADRRLASLQLPPSAEMVAVIPGVGRDAEAELHRMFRASRVRGEWFTPSPELDAIIAANAV